MIHRLYHMQLMEQVVPGRVGVKHEQFQPLVTVEELVMLDCQAKGSRKGSSVRCQIMNPLKWTASSSLSGERGTGQQQVQRSGPPGLY